MLSTGSRRKVMLIAALASGASVTLLDQPFVSLDQASIQVIKAFLHDASSVRDRAWIVADYEAPDDLPVASVLNLSANRP
jgi:ABC-type multidrug transport system ATPase subunit